MKPKPIKFWPALVQVEFGLVDRLRCILGPLPQYGPFGKWPSWWPSKSLSQPFLWPGIAQPLTNHSYSLKLPLVTTGYWTWLPYQCPMCFSPLQNIVNYLCFLLIKKFVEQQKKKKKKKLDKYTALIWEDSNEMDNGCKYSNQTHPKIFQLVLI